MAFNADEGTIPAPCEETSTNSSNIPEKETPSNDDNEEYEPMFGFGMFDEPSPDTTEREMITLVVKQQLPLKIIPRTQKVTLILTKEILFICG